MIEALSIVNILWEVTISVFYDLRSWPIFLVLLLTIIGCLAGIGSFYRGNVEPQENPHASRIRLILYWISLLPSIVWYVLPFLPQSRFPSLLVGVQSADKYALFVGCFGTVVALWGGFRAMKIVGENGKATGPVMVDFLKPTRLLEEGSYARVRHPMFLFDFFTHAGVAVATGALTTFLLLPLYFLCSAIFNFAEEKWVLKPRFTDTFVAYKQRVPGYMTLPIAVILLILGVAASYSIIRMYYGG